MDKRLALVLGLVLVTSGCLEGEDEILNTVAEFDEPWGVDFVDDRTALVTEKTGQVALLDIEEESVQYLDGVPEVSVVGQGGLLDVEHDDGEVFLTYTDEGENGYSTALGKGTLNREKASLEDFERIHFAEPAEGGGAHFGSRVVVHDDHVFYTVGDRGDKEFDDHVSQQTGNELGTTLRLERDGSVPEDNPFLGDEGIEDSIFSYGHRNAQGMTVHPETQEIWQSEHGEQDGDEINVAESGNFGWPETHYGCTYGTGEPIGEQPHDREDVIDPVYYWECNSGGFPPAGMTFYQGDRLEEFDGDLFVGNLAGQYLGRFEVSHEEEIEVEEVDPLLEGHGWRIRDVEQTPRDSLLVLVDDSPGEVVEITEVPEIG